MMWGRKYGRARLLLIHRAAICLTYTQKDKNMQIQKHKYKYHQKQPARPPLVHWAAIFLTYTQDSWLAITTKEKALTQEIKM